MTIFDITPAVSASMLAVVEWAEDDGTGRADSWHAGSTSPAAQRLFHTEAFPTADDASARFDELVRLHEAGVVAIAKVTLREFSSMSTRDATDRAWLTARRFPEPPPHSA